MLCAASSGSSFALASALISVLFTEASVDLARGPLGNCSAGGSYDDNNGTVQAFTVSETS
jgi:hypothetical protein